MQLAIDIDPINGDYYSTLLLPIQGMIRYIQTSVYIVFFQRYLDYKINDESHSHGGFQCCISKDKIGPGTRLTQHPMVIFLLTDS